MTEYNLHRLPYAAETLRDEITAWDEDATFEGDERDGLGVYRVLVVDTGRAKELADLLRPVVEVDSRIVEVYGTAVAVAVTFTDGNGAESREPFHLAGVSDVFNPVDEFQATLEPEPDKPAKKATNKKAATKKP